MRLGVTLYTTAQRDYRVLKKKQEVATSIGYQAYSRIVDKILTFILVYYVISASLSFLKSRMTFNLASCLCLANFNSLVQVDPEL